MVAGGFASGGEGDRDEAALELSAEEEVDDGLTDSGGVDDQFAAHGGGFFHVAAACGKHQDDVTRRYHRDVGSSRAWGRSPNAGFAFPGIFSSSSLILWWRYNNGFKLPLLCASNRKSWR